MISSLATPVTSKETQVEAAVFISATVHKLLKRVYDLLPLTLYCMFRSPHPATHLVRILCLVD